MEALWDGDNLAKFLERASVPAGNHPPDIEMQDDVWPTHAPAPQWNRNRKKRPAALVAGCSTI